MKLRATTYGWVIIPDQGDVILAHPIATTTADEHPEAKLMALRYRTCVDLTEPDARWTICPQIVRRTNEEITVLIPEEAVQ